MNVARLHFCLLLLVAQCKDPQKAQPYNPFGVASADDNKKAIIAAPPSSASPFAPEAGVDAPPAARDWEVFGTRLKAKDGYVFKKALRVSSPGETLNGTTPTKIAAFISPLKTDIAEGQSGEVWLYTAAAEPKRIFTTPTFLPRGEDCQHELGMTRTGTQTLTIDLRARCKAALLPGAPVRSISILAPEREEPLVMTLRLSSPSGGEQPVLKVSTLDRDADGRDDVELSLALALDNKETPSIVFAWLDRKAGVSRDTTRPGRDFKDIASKEVVRAKGKNTSLIALANVDALRRLFASFCAEASSALLLDNESNPVSCDFSSEVSGLLLTAEVRAELTQGRVGNAFAALARANYYGPAAPPALQKSLLSEVEKAVALVKYSVLASPKTKPAEASGMPRFSPLAFDADNALLIQTVEGVVRLQAPLFEEEDANEAVDPWPLTVISPRGERLIGVAYPCDHANVTLLKMNESGERSEPLATPLLAPRPGACRSGKGGSSELTLNPVRWRKDELQIFLGGQELRLPQESRAAGEQSFPLGSARSQNGTFAALATAHGLLVLGRGAGELWRPSSGAAPNYSECVISNDGNRVACLRGRRAELLGRELPTQ